MIFWGIFIANTDDWEFSSLQNIDSEAVVQRCSVKKVFLKINKINKIHRKRSAPEFFFNKVAGLRFATLFRKRLWRRCFPVNFGNFLRTPISTEHLWMTASVDLRSLFNSIPFLCKILENDIIISQKSILIGAMN